MKKNEHGSGQVLILVVLVVLFIGYIGWYFMQTKNKDTEVKQPIVTENTDADAELPKDSSETADWTTFSPKSKFYTIKLPDGWAFLHQNDDCDCLLTVSSDYKPGTPASVETTQGGHDGGTGMMITVDENDKSSERFGYSGIEKVGTIEVDGLKGNKYLYQQTTEPEGIGLEKGSKEYTYYFIKDGKGLYISYSIGPGVTDNVELVEKSIKTLSFN